MANPQVEDGYTPIANDLLEAMIRADLNQREWVLIMTIIRATYGWQEKVTTVPRLELFRRAGLDRSHGYRALKHLKDRRVLHEIDGGIGIQKDYEQWRTPTGSRAESALVPKQHYCQKRTTTSAKRALVTSAESALLPARGRPSGVASQAPKSILKQSLKQKRGDLGNFPLAIGGEKQRKQPADPFDEEAFWRKFSGQAELIHQTEEAIASTRKRGWVAKSVIQAEMQWWDQQEQAKVIQGMQIYLQKGYAAQGKGEKYLRGIIRNCDGGDPRTPVDQKPSLSPGAEAIRRAALSMTEEDTSG